MFGGAYFYIILATILKFKNSVAKTVSKREPIRFKRDAQGMSKLTKSLKSEL